MRPQPLRMISLMSSCALSANPNSSLLLSIALQCSKNPQPPAHFVGVEFPLTYAPICCFVSGLSHFSFASSPLAKLYPHVGPPGFACHVGSPGCAGSQRHTLVIF